MVLQTATEELARMGECHAADEHRRAIEPNNVPQALLHKVRKVVPYASNYVFNPSHPAAEKARILEAERVEHDPRVLSLLSEPRA